jgi:hypothetical protein
MVEEVRTSETSTIQCDCIPEDSKLFPNNLLLREPLDYVYVCASTLFHAVRRPVMQNLSAAIEKVLFITTGVGF